MTAQPSPDPIAAVLGPGGELERRLPGFSCRPQQLSMAHAVGAALDRGEHLLVEAGTGTGKTFAYLVPALLSGQRTVISTGTKVLQDQIYEKDLVALSGIFPLEGRVAVLKGRANYLCLHKYGALAAAAGAFAVTPDEMDLLSDWAGRTETGDLAEVTELAEDHPVWREVTVGAEQCLGGRCADFDACYITRARRNAMAADLIVVNHHLLFADLGVKSGDFGEVIPHYDAVIFDEAHLVEDVATNFFGARVSHYRIRDLVGDVRREATASVSDPAALMADAERVLDRATPFFAHVKGAGAGDGRRPFRPQALGPAFDDAAERLTDGLHLLALALTRNESKSDDLFQLARRAEGIHADLERVLEGPQPETVYWAEGRGGGAVGASPLHVGPLLNEHLYGRVNSAVFTSATLATGDGMGYMRDRLGLMVPGAVKPVKTDSDEQDGGETATAAECLVGSPFDYPEQALLYLPKKMPSPKSGDYAAAVANEIKALVKLTGGRALLLFTSYRMMDAVYERCSESLPGTVFKQGDMSRARLLSAMVEEAPATLFATGSFWQGVDVPGDALSLVVIDRLPFAAPDDPIPQARINALNKAGRNAFMEFQVPMAALTLKQGAGRLIRTTSDRGVVAVLDPRVTGMHYGKVFLNALPPMRRVRELGEVRRFFEG